MMLQLRRHQCLKNNPFGEFLDLFFHEMRWRITERVNAVPAAELNLAQLRVIIRIPVDVALALVRLVCPFEEL